MSAPPALKQVLESRATLSREAAYALMNQVLAGAYNDIQLAALLGGLAARGETAAELAGFVDAMRAAATPLPLTGEERAHLVDTCGTGGDASGTFNISTAAALVAAAVANSAGSKTMVAKHGNRAVTSQSGSADVLEALGIPVTLTPDLAADALRAHRFAFLHAPSHHPAMKAVMPVRRAVGVRTVFNVLGPLTNPAGARAQVMGVYSAHLVPLVAEAMTLLGVRHAFVVHGAVSDAKAAPPPGMDELSTCGTSHIAEVRDGEVALTTITPEEIRLHSAPIDSLRGGDAAANAAILQAIFRGERGPHRDVVLLNTAAVLISAGLVSETGGLSERLRAGTALASAAIDNGSVTALITALADSKPQP
jgi:anthranilate phosphoribosyltransferase